MGVLRSAWAYLSAAPPRAVRSCALFAAAGPLLLGLLVAVAVAVLGGELPDPLQTGYARPRPGRVTESGIVGFALFAALFGALLSGFVWTSVANVIAAGMAPAATVVPAAAAVAWGAGASLTRDDVVNLIANLGSVDAVPGLLLALGGWPVVVAVGGLAWLIAKLSMRRAVLA